MKCPCLFLLISLTAETAAGPLPNPLDLDPSFAGDGTLIIEIAQRDQGYMGLLEESGEIVMFGQSDDSNASATLTGEPQ